LSNIEEVRARRGRVTAIATEGDTLIGDKVGHVIYIPDIDACLIAVLRGCDVDKPRNLAKSVTVE
jgi:glucosamine--fructose-6-phosphate aminotransferase (isomerizing)